MKLKPEDLDEISRRMRATTSLRDGAGRARITVHLGTCGIAAGARNILEAFHLLVDKANSAIPVGDSNATRSQSILLTTSGCAGLCAREPMATIELMGESPVKYVDLTPAKAAKIFEEHVMQRQVVVDYAFVQGSERIS